MTAEAKFPKYETPFFFHIRDLYKNANGRATGVTVCFIPTESGFAPGVSICSESDNFNKKLGRRIAHGRAEVSWSRDQVVKAASYEDLSNTATALAKEAFKKTSLGKQCDI